MTRRGRACACSFHDARTQPHWAHQSTQFLDLPRAWAHLDWLTWWRALTQYLLQVRPGHRHRLLPIAPRPCSRNHRSADRLSALPRSLAAEPQAPTGPRPDAQQSRAAPLSLLWRRRRRGHHRTAARGRGRRRRRRRRGGAQSGGAARVWRALRRGRGALRRRGAAAAGGRARTAGRWVRRPQAGRLQVRALVPRRGDAAAGGGRHERHALRRDGRRADRLRSDGGQGGGTLAAPPLPPHSPHAPSRTSLHPQPRASGLARPF